MVSRAHVTMIVLVTVFSTEWYSYASPLSWHTMSYLTCHLYFLDIHTHLKAREYNVKIQVAREIFHGVTIKSVTALHR